jgi:hypothetical protein
MQRLAFRWRNPPRLGRLRSRIRIRLVVLLLYLRLSIPLKSYLSFDSLYIKLKLTRKRELFRSRVHLQCSLPTVDQVHFSAPIVHHRSTRYLQQIMSQSVLDSEKIFACDPSEGSGPRRGVDVPDSLQSATLRLSFTPSYVIVGVYRLLSDKALFLPVWNMCRRGFLRGIVVGSIWVCYGFSDFGSNNGANLCRSHS